MTTKSKRMIIAAILFTSFWVICYLAMYFSRNVIPMEGKAAVIRK